MLRRIMLILFAGFVLAARLPAQEEATESEPIIIEAEDEADESADAEDQGAAAARAEEADEDRFIPSREVPPDEQVIFPIDI